jgi:hypothetical protein
MVPLFCGLSNLILLGCVFSWLRVGNVHGVAPSGGTLDLERLQAVVVAVAEFDPRETCGSPKRESSHATLCNVGSCGGVVGPIRMV